MREMEAIFPKSATLDLAKFAVHRDPSPFVKELTLASRAAAAAMANPEFRAIQANTTRIAELAASTGIELNRTLAPFGAVLQEMGAQFASQLDYQSRALDEVRLAGSNWLSQFESVTSEMTKMARINFAIPESALLHWPSKVFAGREQLLQDCILNTSALEKFHAAMTLPAPLVSPDQLAVATQFVVDHAEIVRRLPPRLPLSHDIELPEDRKKPRDEEIGAKLEVALGDFDPRLLELRQQAWRNLPGGIAGARLAMAGIRELFTDILHALAPDDKVMATAMWQSRPKDITRPTRRMRLEYVLGEQEACEADGLLQFSESVNRTQRFVHAFADDIELVRVQMAHLEIWIYLLLLYRE